jgi:hypothetical protein
VVFIIHRQVVETLAFGARQIYSADLLQTLRRHQGAQTVKAITSCFIRTS